MKYLVVINQYENAEFIDQVFNEWEREPKYQNGKTIFHLVEAEDKDEARYRLIKKLIPAWDDAFTTETLWHINDCLLDHYEHMDKRFLGSVFTTITENMNANGKIDTPEQLDKVFSDEIKLAVYQDLMLTTYHAYEYAILGLRTKEGILLSEYEKQSEQPLAPQKIEYVKRLCEQGYATFDGDRFAFTDWGFYVSSHILTELF